MSDRDNSDIAHLRRIAHRVDPAPDSVHAAARAAIRTRDLNAELADLVADSAVMSGSLAFDMVRRDSAADAGARMLSFRGDGVQIELQVSDQGEPLALAGLITGAAPNSCVLQHGSASERRLELDTLGRFLVTDVPLGPTRVRCQSVSGSWVNTRWVSL
jgi:hypothetical protein